jgi:protocatechuate 3,4-dioxygenase beta subunit
MISLLIPFNPLDRKVQPPYLHAAYTSTLKRAPLQALVMRPHTLTDLTGPVFGDDAIRELDNDLTRNAVINGEPLGERINVSGRILDDNGNPIRGALLELWQANAAGRYLHHWDQDE